MSSLMRVSVANMSPLEAKFADLLREQMAFRTGRRVSPSEVHSWENSIPRLVADLRDAGLGNVELLFEYQLPLSSKRADVIIAGHHRRTGDPHYLVVELKQWSQACLYEGDPNLVSVPNWRPHPVTHPLVQVRGYVDHIADFTAAIAEHPEAVAGVAYLHNAHDRDVHDLLAMPQDSRGRLFTGEHRGEFVEHLASVFDNAPGRDAADLLVNSHIAPSRNLLSVAAEEVQRREVFTLLDEQRDAFELVRHHVVDAHRANTKTAVVITGGPGSGKSVIALSLLGELSRQGRTVLHATGSRSFTQTLRKTAGARSPRTQQMFKYFNSFMDAETNDLDCLILDEAHRIRETSVNRYTRKEVRAAARPQIDELLDAARVPVFLLDEHQVVRPGELGTVAQVRAAARARGMQVDEISLNDQFRCGGSQIYVEWVLHLLDLSPGGARCWSGDPNFEVRIFEDPASLEKWLASHQGDGHTSRIAAGYCWPWSDPDNGVLVPDVRIGDWQRPWNLRGDRSVDGAPPSALWASDPAGFGQVGCVYTAQGFEYDFAGVILGPDMVRRDGAWHFVRGANKDPDFRSTAKVSDSKFEALIRNVYKVLLTRGMQGVGIYSTDAETREFLRGLVPSTS